jgi:hypothetical protein
MAAKEASLLTENTRRVELVGELQRLQGGGGARTLRDRQRLAEATRELEQCEGALAGLRRWIKSNAPL